MLGIWTKFLQICVRPSICSSIKAPRPKKICQGWGNSTVSSAQNGSKASTAWLCIERVARIKEGKKTTYNMSGSRTNNPTRVKALKDEPYTQKEAEAAVGLRTDNGPRQAAKKSTRDVEIDMETSGFVEEAT
jgi:hypothetical protein